MFTNPILLPGSKMVSGLQDYYFFLCVIGMLAATAVLENGGRPGMAEEEAKKLVRDAIAAGIINDMGSGSNVDLAIIKPNDDCKVS